MLTFFCKFLFFMLVVVYCSQPGYHTTIVVILYISAMLVTALVEFAAWLHFDELIRKRSLGLQDSLTLEFISGHIPIIALWTMFFTFCHVIIAYFVLSIPMLAIAIAVMGFNSTIHLQRMEKALK